MDKIILEYNEWLVKQNIYSMSNGLLNGRMGLCLYWYHETLLREHFMLRWVLRQVGVLCLIRNLTYKYMSHTYK